MTVAAFIAFGGLAMPKKSVKKSVRLTDMQELLRDAWLTVAQLAYLYGVSLRTIQRDLEDIQAAPIYAAVVNDGKRPVRYHVTERPGAMHAYL